VVLTSSFINKEPLFLKHLQQHPHTLPRKCVKWRRLTTNNDLLQQLNVMEDPRHQGQGSPSSSFPVDPDFCVKIPSQLLTLDLTFVKGHLKYY
jgi:hypothetical protein